jgi:hypothetical protein
MKAPAGEGGDAPLAPLRRAACAIRLGITPNQNRPLNPNSRAGRNQPTSGCSAISKIATATCEPTFSGDDGPFGACSILHWRHHFRRPRRESEGFRRRNRLRQCFGLSEFDALWGSADPSDDQITLGFRWKCTLCQHNRFRHHGCIIIQT